MGDIELNKEENVCFVAGSTRFSEDLSTKQGDAVISALHIGPKMTKISTLNLGSEFGCVLKIKKSSRGKHIFLGCHTAIIELSFEAGKLSVVSVMKLGRNDTITDFFIYEEGERDGLLAGREIYYLTKKAPKKIRNLKYSS